MMDREKVINCIKYCINHPLCIDCDACDYGGESSVICDRLIQDTLALLKEQPQWVSVKDRMPEENVPVLVWELQGFAYVDVYKDGAWEVGTPNLAKFTHWMPLPEPPKEVSE